jgi:biotin synthase
LRIETTDKALYEKMDPGMSWDNRLRCLHDLKELGFEVGTGSLVGLPGQTVKSLARDVLFFQELDVDMVGIGPFIPNPDTPLAEASGGTFDLACRMMSLTRLLLPDANIPATTAMETLQPDGRMLALQRGANVVMPNVTDTDYRKMYMLYPGKICLDDAPAHCRGCVTGKIQGIGRTISLDQGFRRKRQAGDYS